MKKRIISILCAAVMTFMMTESAFALGIWTYYQLKNATLSEVSEIFVDAFSDFSISKDGNTYTLPDMNMIILDAWHKGFSSFDELDRNVTAAAAELNEKKTNPTLSDDPSYGNGYGTQDTLNSPASTDPANIFKIGGKEFILLDKMYDNGEPIFFVMAKDYYGSSFALDGNNECSLDATNSKTLAYKLTNYMAFGNFNSGYGGTDLPEQILSHLDYMHVWDVEATTTVSRYSFVAPITSISLTEFQKYSKKIGDDAESVNYWTRTPVKNSSTQSFSITTGGNTAKSNSYGSRQVRPVFYLKESFFKEEKLEKCGTNVLQKINEVMTDSDVRKLYTQDEIRDIFGTLSVVPNPLSGEARVGATLEASYYRQNEITLESMVISWEKSRDKIVWEPVEYETNLSTYCVQSNDEGYYIRASFAPTFNSSVIRVGEVSYTEPTELVDSLLAAIGRGIVGEKIVGMHEFEGAVDIQWQRGSITEEEEVWTDIPGANALEYIPTADDIGYYIRMNVTPRTGSIAGEVRSSLMVACPVRPISTPVASDTRIVITTQAKPGEILDVKYSFNDENRDICSGTEYIWETSEDKISTNKVGNTRYYKLENKDSGKYVRVGVVPKKLTNSASGRAEVVGEVDYSDWLYVENLPFASTLTLKRSADARITVSKTKNGISIKSLLSPLGKSIEKLTAVYDLEKSDKYNLICEWQGSDSENGEYSTIVSGTDILEYVPKKTMWVRAKVYTKDGQNISRLVISDPIYIGREKVIEPAGEFTLTKSLTAGKTYEIWLSSDTMSDCYVYSFRVKGIGLPDILSDKYHTTKTENSDNTYVMGTLTSGKYSEDAYIKAGEITLVTDMEIAISEAMTATFGVTDKARVFVVEKQ